MPLQAEVNARLAQKISLFQHSIVHAPILPYFVITCLVVADVVFLDFIAPDWVANLLFWPVLLAGFLQASGSFSVDVA